MRGVTDADADLARSSMGGAAGAGSVDAVPLGAG